MLSFSPDAELSVVVESQDTFLPLTLGLFLRTLVTDTAEMAERSDPKKRRLSDDEEDSDSTGLQLDLIGY